MRCLQSVIVEKSRFKQNKVEIGRKCQKNQKYYQKKKFK